jgi:hypothetical protein
MEIVMILEISRSEETLLKELGVAWNGWQYEHAEFLEINFELEANGIPTYSSFEEYLEGRVAYKRKVA